MLPISFDVMVTISSFQPQCQRFPVGINILTQIPAPPCILPARQHGYFRYLYVVIISRPFISYTYWLICLFSSISSNRWPNGFILSAFILPLLYSFWLCLSQFQLFLSSGVYFDGRLLFAVTKSKTAFQFAIHFSSCVISLWHAKHLYLENFSQPNQILLSTSYLSSSISSHLHHIPP